jgi:hypothetical protein
MGYLKYKGLTVSFFDRRDLRLRGGFIWQCDILSCVIVKEALNGTRLPARLLRHSSGPLTPVHFSAGEGGGETIALLALVKPVKPQSKPVKPLFMPFSFYRFL